MKKVINPCICEVYGIPNIANAFVKIEYDPKEGRLSISGVIGPTRNGSCKGSAGQCADEIRKGVPTGGWTQEMLDKFCDIWDEWHLNDMRAYCPHQKELGWREQAREEITLYHYRLKTVTNKERRLIEEKALTALRRCEPYFPTKQESLIASLPYIIDVYGELDEQYAPYYEPKKSLYAGDSGWQEKKLRGWVRYTESDKGLLCKPCPICGYEYGTKLLKEEVPQEILDWLFSLPSTKITPAWV